MAGVGRRRVHGGNGEPVRAGQPHTVLRVRVAERVASVNGGVTWNTYLKRYVAVGVSRIGDTCGWFASTSEDLIRWTTRQLMKQAPIGFGGPCGVGGAAGTEMYVSLIDHNDTTDNFERSGQNAYIYFTRYVQANSLNRDLVRVPIRFDMK